MTSQVYTLDGPKEFTFPHPVRRAEQLTLEVRPGGVVPPAEYEVIGASPTATGVTVRWLNAPVSGVASLVITRFTQPDRQTQFEEDIRVTARGLNAEFDNLYQYLEDFSAQYTPERVMQLDELDSGTVSPVMPQADPFKALVWNDDGTALRNVDLEPSDTALREQLASTTEGQGASLVGTASGDTVESALSQRVIYVGSVAELEGLSLTDGTPIYLSDGGRSGVFVFRAGDRSAEVADDPRQAFWVAAGGQPTGSAGAWEREYDKAYGINILWFGCNADGVTSDFDAFEAAIAFAETNNSTLRIPSGVYSTHLFIYNGGMSVIAEKGVLIRPSSFESVVFIGPDSSDVYIEGLHVSGQRLEQVGTTDCASVHGFDVRGRNISLRDISAEATRFDSFYIAAPEMAHITVEEFFFGDTSRNALSITKGSHIYLKRGTIYNKGDYGKPDATTPGGLRLYDIEPNDVINTVHHVFHEEVSFQSANPKSNTAQVVLIARSNGADNKPLDIHFDKCAFGSEADGTLAYFRILNYEEAAVKRIFVRNSTFADGMILNNSTDGTTFIEESEFKNISTGNQFIVFAAALGKYSSLENIRTKAGTETLTIGVDSANLDKIRFINVQGRVDVIHTIPYIPEDPNIRVYTKAFSLTDDVNYLDALTLGLRTSYKITVVTADASSGAGGAIVETMAVVTGTYTAHDTPTALLEVPAAGIDVQWKAANGATADARTLQVRPQALAFQQIVIKVEATGSFVDGVGGITWL